VVQFLIENAGADMNQPNHKGEVPLLEAASKGRMDIVRYLVEQGADPKVTNTDGETVLHIALMRGEDLTSIKFLLQHFVDVNKTNIRGETALHWAVWGGDIQAVRLLVKHGADGTIKSEKGETALIQAALRGRTDIVKFFSQDKGAVEDDVESLGLYEC
jgi:ankyrin repeat protein